MHHAGAQPIQITPQVDRPFGNRKACIGLLIAEAYREKVHQSRHHRTTSPGQHLPSALHRMARTYQSHLCSSRLHPWRTCRRSRPSLVALDPRIDRRWTRSRPLPLRLRILNRARTLAPYFAGTFKLSARKYPSFIFSFENLIFSSRSSNAACASSGEGRAAIRFSAFPDPPSILLSAITASQ